jgi:hypothetical protein
MEEISEPFRVCFKVMNLYGFYLRKDAKLIWKIYGVAIFCTVHLHFCVVSLYNLKNIKNITELLLPLLYANLGVCLVAMTLCFKCNESKIIELIKEFNELDEKLDTNVKSRTFSLIRRFISILLVTDVTVGIFLGITVLVFSKTKVFLLPMFYISDSFLIHFILYLIHCPLSYMIGTTVTTLESIFTISMILMSLHMEELCKQMKILDPINKEKLKNVVEYHFKLLR